MDPRIFRNKRDRGVVAKMGSANTLESQEVARGAALYQTGDAATQVFLIRAGLVSICLSWGDKLIEIARAAPPQLIGVEALHGSTIRMATAIASNDVEVVPIDVKVAREWIEKSPPLLRVFFTSLLAKSSVLSAEEFDSQLRHNDPTPCPASCITKLFAVIYHAASYTGMNKNGKISVVWSPFKKYCLRAFLESPVRLEQAVMILSMMGICKLDMVPVEDTKKKPQKSRFASESETEEKILEEIGTVHFLDIEKVRHLYESNHRVSRGDKSIEPSADYTRLMDEIASWNSSGKVKAG